MVHFSLWLDNYFPFNFFDPFSTLFLLTVYTFSFN